MEENRILGLDVGRKRIGLAISDGLGLTAQPLSLLKRKDISRDLAELKKIIAARDIKKIVVGLPLNMNGSTGKMAIEILDFVKSLKDNLSPPVITWDERFTSLQAESLLLEADVSRRKRKEVIDKLSAQLILQGYLDSQSPPPNSDEFGRGL